MMFEQKYEPDDHEQEAVSDFLGQARTKTQKRKNHHPIGICGQMMK